YDTSEISIPARSAMLLSWIRKYNDSFFRRLPSQTGHFTSSMNSFAQRFNAVVLASSNWVLMKLEIPSNSILYSFVTPSVFDSTANLSLPPFMITSSASAEILEIGSDNLNPNFSPIISSCLKIHVDLYSPSGTKPPCLIESFGFG